MLYPNELIQEVKLAQSMNQRALLCNPLPTPGNCETCGGIGALWLQITQAGPFASPRHGKPCACVGGSWYTVESKMYTCPMCQGAARDEKIEALWSASGLEISERHWRIDYIDGMPGKELALTTARSILASLPNPGGMTCIHGDYGRGKSGLLKSIVASCVLAGISARYAKAADILGEIRATFNHDDGQSEAEIMACLKSVKVLAIDELNRISDTEWAASEVFTILDNRHRRRDIVATIMATNVAPDQLPDKWAYLVSRLQDGERILIAGDDLRGKIGY